MALTTGNATFQTTFLKGLSPPKLQVTDTTDYVLAGVNIANVTIFLKFSIITSSGTSVIYDNLNGTVADITPNTSLVNSAVSSLPVTGDNLTFGTYEVEAQYVVIGQGDVFITTSYAYNWTPPTITISHSVNISTSTITTIDTTDYTSLATSITKVHTTSPPPNSGGMPLVSSISTNVYQGIYTGTWSDKVVSTVTFTFSNGLIVIDILTGCVEFKVLSDIDINKVLCCVGNVKKRYEKLQFSNAVKAHNMKLEVIEPLDQALLDYLIYITAGCTDKAACALDKIINLTECGDCKCSDGCSVPILPLITPANVYVVDSPDLSISVIPQTVGSTVTYHIQVSATLQNILANIATYVLTSTGGSVTVTTTTVGNVTTFNVEVPTYVVDSPDGSVTVTSATVGSVVTYSLSAKNTVFNVQADEVFNTGTVNSALYKYTSVGATDLTKNGDFLDVWAQVNMDTTWTPPAVAPTIYLVVKDSLGNEYYGNGGLLTSGRAYAEFHYSIHRVSASVIRIHSCYYADLYGFSQVGTFDLTFDAAQNFDIFIRTDVDASSSAPCGTIKGMSVTRNLKK